MLAAAVAFVYYEWNSSKSEYVAIAQESTQNLTDALRLSIENAILSNNEIETQVVERLNSAAYIVGSQGTRGKTAFAEIASDLGISALYLTDGNGRVVRSSDEFSGPIAPDLNNQLHDAGLAQGEYSELGIVSVDSSLEDIYAVARRTNGGFAIAGYSADRLLEFRKRIGIGKQIAEIGDNQDIAYLVLQDTIGIISATSNIAEISSIAADSFLLEAYLRGETRSRLHSFGTGNVLETVAVLSIGDEAPMLIRLAISMGKFDELMKQSLSRNIALGFGFFAVSCLAFYLGFVRKRYSSLRAEHSRQKTLNDSILESISDCVLVVDSRGLVMLANDACVRFFGADPTGKNIYSLTADGMPWFRFGQPSSTYSETEIELRGEKRPIGYSISEVLAEDGQTRAWVVVFNDLTELNEARRQAERRDKLSAMGELSAQVAHEIRNPLNSISIIAQRFLMEFQASDSDEEFKKLARSVRSEAERVNRIIRQFLEFARPKEIHPSPCDVSELLRACVHFIAPAAKESNIEIALDIRFAEMIMADADKLKQVFLNIIQNAIAAMKNGGKLEIGLSESNGCIHISFADTGEGIAPEHLPKIFNLYFTTKSDGSGLGLSISNQIIAEHGGQIKVESTPGQGSTFRIELPWKR